MIGIGVDIMPPVASGSGAAALPLLEPGATMVVIGDSLADQARSQYSHPLFWAAAKGQRLDFVYRGEIHNLAIGTSGLNADPASIAGGPDNLPTARGLLHPTRLTRDIGFVESYGAKVVLTDIDTNTFRATTHAQSIVLRQQLDTALFDAGVERIIHGVIAPKHGLSEADAAFVRARNAALYDYAASDPRLFVYDGHESELDPVLGASNYAPLGGSGNNVPGASTGDGVHWSPAHAARRGPALRAVLERIFPPKSLPGYTLADVYSYSSSRYANALGAFAGFGGTGGAFPAGASGAAPQSWDMLGSGWPTGMSILFENDVDVPYGGATRKGCRVNWSGTPADNGGITFQAKTYPPVGSDADNKLRLDGTEKVKNLFVLEFNGFSGCSGINFEAYDYPSIAPVGGGGAGWAGGAILPALNGLYVWSNQTGRAFTSAQGALAIYGGFAFTAGVPVSGSVTMIYAEFGHEA